MRKTVTALFSDVIDSTPLGERLDAETYRRVISRYFVEVSRVLERHGGTVEKFIGDAVMAVFGIPVAHEDDALRAVRAATELREALAALNADLRPEYGVELGARIGINTGEVVAGDPSEGQSFATGEAVAVAQRLEAAASPGEILIGDATYGLVRDAVLVEPLEPLELKGLSTSTAAWRLLGVVSGAPAFARRLDAPMVGREAELEQLRAAFEHAVEERSCRLVTVLGSAGIGKSRLANELLSRVADDATVLSGHCLPYGEGITYWPLRDVVRDVASELSQAKLEDALTGDVDAARIAARLAGAIGIGEGLGAPEETMWAVRRLLEHLARQRPLIVGFDDLQWAEATFLDLIEYLCGWSRDAPILIFCLARPELLDRRPSWHAAGETIVLTPLSPPQAEQMLENLRGETEVGQELLGRITEAAEGNPLFVEQMLAMLTENGGESNVAIPPSIHALLNARLDRLDPGERAVVERASVIGKEFWRGAVSDLSPAADREFVGPQLMTLVRKDLIEAARSIFPSDDGFRFRHILIRDAAYLAIPKQRRADLHERYAGWLERTAHERGDEQDEIVGYHLEQAYHYREELSLSTDGAPLAARASRLLSSAGRRALANGDMPAAAGLLTRATALLGDDEPDRLALLPDLGAALRDTGELARADETLSGAIADARAVGDRLSESLALLELAALRMQTEPGRTDEALETAERALETFEELGDENGLAKAWSLVANVHWIRCRLGKMDEVLDRALEHAEKAGDRRGVARLRNAGARATVFGPTPVEEGLRRCEQILEAARGDRSSEAVMTTMIGSLHSMRGDFTEARELYSQSRAILEDLGLEVFVHALRTYFGLTELLAGEPEAAEHEFRLGFEAFERMGEKGQLSTNAAYLARALSAQGKHSEAHGFTIVSEQAASADDFVSQVVWRQARARACAGQEELDTSEALAREAVALASETDFLVMQGDALTDLAETLRLKGQAVEEEEMLRQALDVYLRKGATVASEQTQSALARLDRSRDTR
jgi:class 3 adenylate cyclase/tetratricopeptide (TPR) repeat protein